MKRKSIFSTKNIIVAVTILCLLSIILTWESREEVSPLEKTLAYVVIPAHNGINVFGNWVKEKAEFITNIKKLEKINNELESKVNQLQYDNKILQMDKTELERLRELYTLDKRYADYPKIGAQIIGKDPSNWYKTFLINKGEKNGLKVNMIVLAGNGLVGHITEVGPNYAKVQTIISDNCNVSSKIMRTSDLCIVKGDLSLVSDKAFCRVDYIDDKANIVIGDEVITSHLGSMYPQGILIGTIKEIETDSSKLTRTAILEPAVDFKRLEEVLVLNQVWDNGLPVDANSQKTENAVDELIETKQQDSTQ